MVQLCEHVKSKGVRQIREQKRQESAEGRSREKLVDCAATTRLYLFDVRRENNRHTFLWSYE
jgi:hypothetical protein